MEALIEISGVIGDFGHEPKYTFTNLASDIKEARAKGATSFKFLIDSDGGLVNEGFLMASYIQNLPEKTTAIALRVYSIANVIFFACDNRESEKYGTFMVHQAWGGIEGNSNELREYASILDKEDDRIATYIASRTGLDFQAVKGLMGTDRFIEKSEAEKLGFLTKAMSLKIAALYTHKKVSTMSKAKDALNTIAKFLGVNMDDEATPELEAVNMELTLEDGAMIYVESEDGELEGKATDAPDGTHKLQDGRSITVEGGIVTSVQEDSANMEGEEDAEKVAMQEQIAELQAQLQQAMAMKKEQEDKHKALEDKLDYIAKNMSTGKQVPAKHARFNKQEQNGKPEDKAEQPKGFGSLQARLQAGEKLSELVK